jgi:MoxR-like ATPase
MTDSGYIASRELLQVWEAVVKTGEGGQHPLVLMFLGPSGCGKTVGAEYLADLAGMTFTKVDAAAMTDPEAWFGTREVVSRDGVSVTTYRPSTFVQAIGKPGVVLIDEVNRVRDEHRNILLPLLDGTHQVTNPLTGEVVRKDPGCYIIMSGNRGLQFTGTYAVDPALMTRSIVLEFDYLGADDETKVAIKRTGADPEVAALFVRFGQETRMRAKINPDISPVSTREVLAAAELAAKGLPLDLAAQVAIINGASDEGGAESIRQQLAAIWGGIRPAK